MSQLKIMEQLIKYVKPEYLDDVRSWIKEVEDAWAKWDNDWYSPEYVVDERFTKSGKKEYIKKS